MKTIIKMTSVVLSVTLLLGATVMADDKVDIGSSAVVKDLSNFVSSMKYEPRERINNVTFKYNGRVLSSIKDYTITYENNRNPGTAKVTYTGVGDFTGTYVKTFKIVKMPISEINTKAKYNDQNKLTVSANNGSSDLVYGKDFRCVVSVNVYGKTTVKFYGMGKLYNGYIKKTISESKYPFKPAVSYLKNVKITKTKNKKGKKIYLKWKKIKNISGYQIQYNKKTAFSSAKKVTLDNKTTKYTIKKLKKKKTYYLRMRSYLVYNNKTYYGDWSKAVKVKIKK